MSAKVLIEQTPSGGWHVSAFGTEDVEVTVEGPTISVTVNPDDDDGKPLAVSLANRD